MPDTQNEYIAWFNEFLRILPQQHVEEYLIARVRTMNPQSLWEQHPDDVQAAMNHAISLAQQMGAAGSLRQRQQQPPVMFKVFLKQHGEGCDYTIGCGRDLRDLSAQTMEEAVAEVKAMLVGSGDVDDDYEGRPQFSEDRIESAVIYPVAGSFTVPVTEWEQEAAAREEARETRERTERDEAEFERLRQRLGR